MAEVEQPQFNFGDIVVVDLGKIGVVVKIETYGKDNSWIYTVYVRFGDKINKYSEGDLELK